MARGGLRNREVFEEREELDERVVDITRVAKVVKGGRRFRFAALVVIGNRSGQVGIGYGKANEVPTAVEKGIKNAKKNLVTIQMKGRTRRLEVLSRTNLSLIH